MLLSLGPSALILGGRREGQVHLTLSPAGLVNGFNHLLCEVAEIAVHIATELLGPEGFCSSSTVVQRASPRERRAKQVCWKCAEDRAQFPYRSQLIGA